MRVVGIGGSGYIGRAVVERPAERRDTPVAVSRSEPRRLPDGAETRPRHADAERSLVEECAA
jgi:nucleoside-diphosphate-sugar epimerase